MDFHFLREIHELLCVFHLNSKDIYIYIRFLWFEWEKRKISLIMDVTCLTQSYNGWEKKRIMGSKSGFINHWQNQLIHQALNSHVVKATDKRKEGRPKDKEREREGGERRRGKRDKEREREGGTCEHFVFVCFTLDLFISLCWTCEQLCNILLWPF